MSVPLYQSSLQASPSSPTTATVRPGSGSRGSRPSFLSRTTACSAASRASARCSSVSRASTPAYGSSAGSNSPSAKRRASSRRTAVSMSLSSIRPLRQCVADAAGHDRGVRAVVGEAVDARLQGGGGGLLVGVEVVLGVDQVGGRARVRADDERLVGPAPQLLLQERGDVVGAAVDQVVGGHDPGHRAGPYRVAEGPQVVLVQDARADRGGGGVAVGLVVVREPVLEHGGGAPVAGVVAAQSPGVGDGDGGGQRGVLGVPLLTAAPQRVAQQIHRRRPDVEPDAVVLGALGAHLVADGLADPADQVVVPGGTEADGLREDGGGSHPGDPVQGFLSGTERADAQPLHRGGELVEHRDPLVEREPSEQIVGAPGEGQLRVAEGKRMVRHVRVPLERWEVSGSAGAESSLDVRRRSFEALRCSAADPAGVKGTTAPKRPFRACRSRTTARSGSATGPRNIETNSCVAGTLHLTSLQHRSASTRQPVDRFSSAGAVPPARPVTPPTSDTGPSGSRRRGPSCCTTKG